MNTIRWKEAAIPECCIVHACAGASSGMSSILRTYALCCMLSTYYVAGVRMRLSAHSTLGSSAADTAACYHALPIISICVPCSPCKSHHLASAVACCLHCAVMWRSPGCGCLVRRGFEVEPNLNVHPCILRHTICFGNKSPMQRLTRRGATRGDILIQLPTQSQHERNQLLGRLQPPLPPHILEISASLATSDSSTAESPLLTDYPWRLRLLAALACPCSIPQSRQLPWPKYCSCCHGHGHGSCHNQQHCVTSLHCMASSRPAATAAACCRLCTTCPDLVVPSQQTAHAAVSHRKTVLRTHAQLLHPRSAASAPGLSSLECIVGGAANRYFAHCTCCAACIISSTPDMPNNSQHRAYPALHIPKRSMHPDSTSSGLESERLASCTSLAIDAATLGQAPNTTGLSQLRSFPSDGAKVP